MRAKIIGVVVVALTVLVIAIVVFGTPQSDPEPVGTEPPVMGVDGVVGDEPDAGIQPDGEDHTGLGEGEEGHGEHSMVDDMSAYYAVAEAALREFIYYDHAESREDRAARIAPYLTSSSSMDNKVPVLAQESKWGYVGYDAQVRITSVDLVTVSEISEDQTMFKISALITYEATYSSPAQKQVHQDRKIWDLWVTADGAPLVESVDEPAVGK